MLVFNNSIEFFMEECIALQSFSEKDERDLLKNLANLHHFKIMHLDINPQNVMFSPSLQKIEFIDYGYSKIIAEDIGFKIFMVFMELQSMFQGTCLFYSLLKKIKVLSIFTRMTYLASTKRFNISTNFFLIKRNWRGKLSQILWVKVQRQSKLY